MKQRMIFIVDTEGDYKKGAPTKLADLTQGQKDSAALQEASLFAVALNGIFGEYKDTNIKMRFTVESAEHLED